MMFFFARNRLFRVVFPHFLNCWTNSIFRRELYLLNVPARGTATTSHHLCDIIAMTSSSSFSSFSFLFLEDHEDVVAVVQNCSLLCVSLPNAYERKTRGTVWMTTHALCFEPKNDFDKDEDKEPGSRTRARTSALAQVLGESPGGTKTVSYTHLTLPTTD